MKYTHIIIDAYQTHFQPRNIPMDMVKPITEMERIIWISTKALVPPKLEFGLPMNKIASIEITSATAEKNKPRTAKTVTPAGGAGRAGI